MNKQSIHQQIDLLLKLISEQHETNKQGKQSVSQIEMDMFVQNLRQLYEAALMLNHVNALTSLDEVKAAVTQKILAGKRIVEMKTAEQSEPTISEQNINADKMEEEPIHSIEEVIAKTISAELVVDVKKEIAKPKKNSSDINTLFEHVPTHGERFEDGETLQERIAAKVSSGKTVGHTLHHKPITDLKAAIGINEKFLFINKLFDGNVQDYTTAIEKINSCGDLTSAQKYISDELSSQLNWNESSEHVKTFFELVERRFTS